MKWFRRKPRITEDNYGKLMTSFGRAVDRDPLVKGPAQALADRVIEELGSHADAVDRGFYRGAAVYHLRLLAGSWIMAAEGSIPRQTAEVFEEAVVWKFEPLARGSGELARRLSRLARGEIDRRIEPIEGFLDE